jgi:hypothetical protein
MQENHMTGTIRRLVRAVLTIVVGAGVVLAGPGAVAATAASKPTVPDAATAALTWTVDLTAHKWSTTEPNWPTMSVRLVASTNQDVGPTPYWIQISGPSGVLITCGTGYFCETYVNSNQVATQQYTARVVMLVSPYTLVATDSVTVAWKATTVTLSAAAHTVPFANNALVTMQLGRAIMPGPLSARLEDADTGQVIPGCGGFSTVCTATVQGPDSILFNTRKFVGRIGYYDTSSVFHSVVSSAPIWVTWSDSGYQLTLTPTVYASTAYVDARANKLGTIRIMNADTGAIVKTCDNATLCSASANGSYVAFVMPWGTAAASNTVIGVAPSGQ